MLNVSEIREQIYRLRHNRLKLNQYLIDTQCQLDKTFKKNLNIHALLKQRTQLIDILLKTLWEDLFEDTEQLCLFALGGYGRKELLPYSDIDLLIISKQKPTQRLIDKVSRFLSQLWDLKLTIGHSLYCLDETFEIATQDITIYTSFLEKRFLCGEDNTCKAFIKKLNTEIIWSDKSFFEAKLIEQQNRHLQYNQTAHLLEPDIKKSPGALRDIHVLHWLILKFFPKQDFSILAKKNILSKKDLAVLTKANAYLLTLRYALHNLNHKNDNRLLFDKQVILSGLFGFNDSDTALAVEHFMKKYHLMTKEVRAFSEMIIQYFYESISTSKTPVISLGKNFFIQDQALHLKKEVTFARNCALLIQVFTEVSTKPNIQRLGFNTLKQIREDLSLINSSFNNNADCQKQFLTLFKKGKQISLSLRLMTLYGVLGKYLPEFDFIIGQTQHDLFHLYTVEQHTLFVLQKIDILAKENIFFKNIFQSLPKPEILYFAAFFHDIGKGRRTNHSVMGEKIAMDFARTHGLKENENSLIAWLVRDHLLLSHTAQKQDVNDPEVINRFLTKVKTLTRLNYLLLLTMADIQATNEVLWNSWRQALIEKLYQITKKALLTTFTSKNQYQLLKAKKSEVLKLLASEHFNLKKVDELWECMGNKYFLKEDIHIIAWHTKVLYAHNGFTENRPIIDVNNKKSLGATTIFICSKDKPNLFACMVEAMNALNLNIVEAKIITSKNGFSLDTYSVLNDKQKMITDERFLSLIRQGIFKNLTKASFSFKITQRRIPRQLAHFYQKPNIKMRNKPASKWTLLSIHTTDRPGLLAHIGLVFAKEKIKVHRAKIITMGYQVEDIFHITDYNDTPLKNRKLLIQLHQHLQKEINP